MIEKILKWGAYAVGIAAGLMILGWMAVHGFLAFEHKRISSQGEIPNVLPNTSYLKDDRTVLFFRDKSLYAIQLNGADERKLYENVAEYHWSPDGGKIVLRTFGKEADAVIFELGTGAAEGIEHQVKCSLPEWSPDGRKLTYVLGDKKLLLYDTHEKIKTELASYPSDILVGPKWSTDGEKIFYHLLFGQEYFKYDLASKKAITLSGWEKNLKRSSWYDYIDIQEMYFNQFNDRITGHFGRISPNGKYRVDNKEGSLWLEKPDGFEPLVHFRGIYNVDFGQPGITDPEWLPNNRAVLCSFRKKIYAVDVET